MQRCTGEVLMSIRPPQDATIGEEDHKLPTERWVNAINADDLPALAGVIATEFLDHHPLPGQGGGLVGLIQMYGTLRTAFPDWQIVVERMLVDGDIVAVHSTWHGTHQGEFLSIPPTGAQFTVPAVDVLRIANGKIAERWGVVDLFGIVQQLGILPPMGLAGGSTRLN
jgi:steroid delta-isomerase-like uncharacterized protein